MEIRFENINPINFYPATLDESSLSFIVNNTDIVDINNKEHEYSIPFTQLFDVSDRLQFAFYYHSSIRRLNFVAIAFIKGNTILEEDDILWVDEIDLTNDIDGDFYSFYCSQNLKIREWSGGVVFSKKFNEIFDNTSNSKYCNRFKIVIELLFGNDYQPYFFMSNEIEIKNGAKGKLLEYEPKRESSIIAADSRSTELGKFFPYAIRIDSNFLQPQFKTEREIFVNYDMHPVTTSAISHESVVLEIGGSNGYPDWFFRKLNNILSVKDKWIDGKEFGIVEGGDLQVEKVQGYNNRFGKVEIAIKKDNLEQFIVTDIAPNVTTIELQREESVMVGELDLIGMGDWSIYDRNDGTLLKVNPNKRQGNGKDNIKFVHDLNLTGADLTYTIVFNTENGEQNIIIIVPPIKTGIGYGVIGQTFYIG